MKVSTSGYLRYVERDNGWDDSIALYDEGSSGKMGNIPLLMDCFKAFHGKDVRITVEVEEGALVDGHV